MNRIMELRKAKGWKQDDLAKMVSLSRSAIANYECGLRAPDFSTLEQLCDIFGCTADYLLGRSDVPPARRLASGRRARPCDGGPRPRALGR